MRNDKLLAVLDELYVELYKAATPPANFTRLVIEHELSDFNTAFWTKHYISEYDEKAITEAVLSRHRLTKRERQMIINSAAIGFAPTNIKP